MSDENNDRMVPRGTTADGDDWPAALAYWRTLPAEDFDGERRGEISRCVGRISSTIENWRLAISGDAVAAVKLALRIHKPREITARLDLAMTVLLNGAFDNPAAALELAHKLNVMPLDRSQRARLATSWLVHNVWLASRRQYSSARRSVDFRAPRGKDGKA
jgi:hypothetical protein